MACYYCLLIKAYIITKINLSKQQVFWFIFTVSHFNLILFFFLVLCFPIYHFIYQGFVMRDCEAKKLDDESGPFHGVLLMDETSIQQDLQVIKCGQDWEVVGAVDLGPLVNDLDQLSKKKKEIKMASHYFQYVFVGFNGFRWPAAHYGTNNVNGHSIYLTVWPLLDELFNYSFKVHGILMDGSNNNHQFTRLMVKPENACLLKYCAADPHDSQNRISIIQDCKHIMKKIRNSVLSSRHDGKGPRQLLLKGKHTF